MFELRSQGVTVPEIVKETGINENTIRFWFKRSGVTKKLASYSDEQYQQAVELAKQNTPIHDISKATGIARSSLWHYFKKQGVRVPNASIKYTKEQYKEVDRLRAEGVPVKEIALRVGMNEGSVSARILKSGIKLTKEQKSKILVSYTEDQKNKIIELRKRGTLISDICKEVQLGKTIVKSIIKDFPLSKQVATKNAGLGKLKLKGFTDWFEFYGSMAKEKGGSLLSSKGEYGGTRSKLKWSCSNGHFWESTPQNIRVGCWCPYCSFTSSKGETEVFEYVKQLVGADVDVKNRDRSLIPPYEIDIVVPQLQLAIEFDGLYWHSSANGTFERGRTFKKWCMVKNLGYRHFLIFEDEWKNKPDLVKAMIRWRLKKFEGTTLNASALNIKVLNEKLTVNSFFERNHLNSYGGVYFRAYGLFDGERLLSCVTVKRNFRKKLEIGRFATDYNYNIRGAAGKLIGRIREDFPGEQLFTFSDNRLGDGEVYERIGFRKIIEAKKPSYGYTDLKKRYNRLGFQRINDLDVLRLFPDVPHNEEAQAEGGVHGHVLFGDKNKKFYRIEDCGHTKWVL